MRIAIMGSGAAGGYYRARLANAGRDTHFAARGAQVEAKREFGLLVRSDAGKARIDHVHVVDDPTETGRAGLLVVSLKLWDTEAAAAS